MLSEPSEMESLFLTAVLVLFGLGGGFHILWMLLGRVPTISSSDAATEMIVELIPEDFDGKLVDLGAGWGALCFSIAARFPNARIVAVERSPFPWLLLLLQRWIFGAKHVEIIRGDLFEFDLKDADIVTLFLLPSLMPAVRDKLANELEPGAVVLSNTFTIPGWEWQERHPFGYIASKRQIIAIYQYEI